MIRLFGDPVLSTPTHKVAPTYDLIAIEAMMLEAMKNAGGIGLAANQLGLSVSMFVMMLEHGGTLTAINPVYIQKSEETHIFPHDGCLSLPGVFAPTRRHYWVTLQYRDTAGGIQQAVFQGLEAVIVQHEMDHLNGLLYIDRLGRLKRSMLLKKYRKLQREKS